LNAHEILHLGKGYDSDLSADTATIGLKEVEKIIKWVETKQELA